MNGLEKVSFMTSGGVGDKAQHQSKSTGIKAAQKQPGAFRFCRPLSESLFWAEQKYAGQKTLIQLPFALGNQGTVKQELQSVVL